MQKNDIVIFVNKDGNPRDKGAENLKVNNQLPIIGRVKLERAKVIKESKNNIIELVIEDDVSQSLVRSQLKPL